MRSYAVIPPLLLDTKQRRIAFQNRNGLLQPEELEALHSERKLINVWSSVEHELFKEKYLQHPKNFGTIAQSLEHKSVPDCVHHYYLTKKAENYKQLLRKSRQRTRSSRNNPNNKVSLIALTSKFKVYNYFLKKLFSYISFCILEFILKSTYIRDKTYCQSILSYNIIYFKSIAFELVCKYLF